MAIEIERKYLVKNDTWRAGAKGRRMVQGYLSRDPHRTVRVRISGEQAWMTVKGPTTGMSREEVEFPLDLGLAQELLGMSLDEPIDKTRYDISFAGMLWEVDEFHGANAGLIVAEIELPHEDHAFEKPDWLGEEVTSERRYSNSKLSKRPWSTWNAEEKNPS
jgi:CYTH domain-containing protein